MEIPEREGGEGEGEEKEEKSMKETERKTRQTRLTQSDDGDGRHMSSASNILGSNTTDFKIDEIKTVKDPRLLRVEVVRVKRSISLKCYLLIFKFLSL